MARPRAHGGGDSSSSRPHGDSDGDSAGRRRSDGDDGSPGRTRPVQAVDNVAHAQDTAQQLASDGRPGSGRHRPDASRSDGDEHAPSGEQTGPPWPVVEGTPGDARGKSLNPPHKRHTIAGTRKGNVDEVNSVILRGHESAVRSDVEQIAAGRAKWDSDASRYEINGRTYGVEGSGKVFPDSGPGLVRLDRNEYAALQQIALAGGDLSKAQQLTRNPRFINNPDAVAKAKSIYDGTYLQ